MVTIPSVGPRYENSNVAATKVGPVVNNKVSRDMLIKLVDRALVQAGAVTDTSWEITQALGELKGAPQKYRDALANQIVNGLLGNKNMLSLDDVKKSIDENKQSVGNDVLKGIPLTQTWKINIHALTALSELDKLIS